MQPQVKFHHFFKCFSWTKFALLEMISYEETWAVAQKPIFFAKRRRDAIAYKREGRFEVLPAGSGVFFLVYAILAEGLSTLMCFGEFFFVWNPLLVASFRNEDGSQSKMNIYFINKIRNCLDLFDKQMALQPCSG